MEAKGEGLLGALCSNGVYSSYGRIFNSTIVFRSNPRVVICDINGQKSSFRDIKSIKVERRVIDVAESMMDGDILDKGLDFTTEFSKRNKDSFFVTQLLYNPDDNTIYTFVGKTKHYIYDYTINGNDKIWKDEIRKEYGVKSMFVLGSRLLSDGKSFTDSNRKMFSISLECVDRNFIIYFNIVDKSILKQNSNSQNDSVPVNIDSLIYYYNKRTGVMPNPADVRKILCASFLGICLEPDPDGVVGSRCPKPGESAIEKPKNNKEPQRTFLAHCCIS